MNKKYRRWSRAGSAIVILQNCLASVLEPCGLTSTAHEKEGLPEPGGAGRHRDGKGLTPGRPGVLAASAPLVQVIPTHDMGRADDIGKNAEIGVTVSG